MRRYALYRVPILVDFIFWGENSHSGGGFLFIVHKTGANQSFYFTDGDAHHTGTFEEEAKRPKVNCDEAASVQGKEEILNSK